LKPSARIQRESERNFFAFDFLQKGISVTQKYHIDQAGIQGSAWIVEFGLFSEARIAAFEFFQNLLEGPVIPKKGEDLGRGVDFDVFEML
jgi:hypothetical protein